MEWLTERPIAHRGLHTEDAPENSLSAFENAVSAGYPAELDVRLTADDVPVVFHDRTLDRLTSMTGELRETSWKTLSNCTLLRTEETVPRLEAVLDTVDGRVPLLVELKHSDRPGLLEQAVTDSLDAYDGPFAVQSFNPLVVGWLRRYRPDWARGQLAGLARDRNALSRVAVNQLLSNTVTHPDFVSYNHELLPRRAVARSRKQGRPVLAWTVTTDSALEAVRPYVDNVIFESLRP